MKYQNRNDALPNRRFLRFEPLESRLPFALEVISFDADSWLMPVVDESVLFDEQWISSPNTTRNELETSIPIDALRSEMAYSIQDLFEATSFYRHAPEDYFATLAQQVAVMGTSVPLVDDVLSTDLGLSDEDALISDSHDSVPSIFSIEQADDRVLLQDLWITTNVSQAVGLPLDRTAADGTAIPVGEFALSSFEGDAGGVRATTAIVAGHGERLVFNELPRMEYTILLSTQGSSIKPDGNLLSDGAAIYMPTHLKWLSAPLQTHDEKSGKLAEQASSFLTQGFSSPDHAGQFQQHYQTLGEMLQRNGIDLANESQLSIEKEGPKSASSSQSPNSDYGSRIEIAEGDAKLPIHILPDGMLAIGSEIDFKNYRRIQNFRLNEDFVAQTALICDDLQTVAIPYGASMETALEESHFFDVPERFQWIAFGGTIIITQASLVARKTSEASLARWLWVKLPKFKKHNPS